MKKIVIIVVSLFIILLGACAEGVITKEKIELPISVTAKLKGSDAPFRADITEDECIVTFGENHSLSGTELRFYSSGGRATIGDFTRDIDINIFPAQKALITAVRTICSDDISGTKTEYGMKYTIDEMLIMVYYDKDNEKIIAIGTEESGRRFEFDIAALEPYEIQSNSNG